MAIWVDMVFSENAAGGEKERSSAKDDAPRGPRLAFVQTRIQIVAIIAMAGLFVLVFELVRRRRLMERYALLWLFAAACLLGLAVWRQALELLARGVGIYYSPSALFAVALGFILMLLLHFSLVISRLSEQNKVLAQRLGVLSQQVEELQVARQVDEVGRSLGDADVRRQSTPG